jgi:hypothetical protein
MAESLYQMNMLMDFMSLLIWTGQLENERPVSAIVVAPAGSGKTTTLESLKCEQTAFVGDLTARPLAGLLNNEKLTHILLGDMLSLFGHKSSTVKLTLRLVSQMTGEKILHNPWTGEGITPRMLGLITAIPPEDFKKQKKHITEGGFASRFIVAKYSYRPSTVAAIHRFIAHDGYSVESKKFFIKDPGKWKVEIPDKLAEQIKDFGVQLRQDPLGFRAHRHLRTLVKAHARRSARPICNETDFKVVQTYCEFFTSEGKEI